MKILFGLYLSFSLIACGERNASDIYGSGDFHYQSPKDDGGWTYVNSAVVVDDHHVRLSIEHNTYEGSVFPYTVLIDEKTETIKSFIHDKEVIFAQFECLSRSNGQCTIYSLKTESGSTYTVSRRKNIRITTQSSVGTTVGSYRAISVLHTERGRSWDYISIETPATTPLYWPVGALWLPDTQLFQTMLGVGLPGSLKESVALYEFESLRYSFFADRSELKATYRHLLTNETEEVLWDLRSEP